jgi:single-stranded-DNA-specific exonuclease
VLADEGWHQGVIGIVASRLVERFHRPVVLVAGAAGPWKGSGRSIAGFDLLDGLETCARHLVAFGGHRAAAGLSIDPASVEQFAAAFAAHADSVLADDDLRPALVVDAVVQGPQLTLGLCSELRRLAPFGLGNPAVTLLAPACRLSDLATVGDGKHLRFRVRDERSRPAGSAIAFGQGSHLNRLRREQGFDVAFRLEENRWNGTVAPQLVVRRVFETPDRYPELRARFAQEWLAGEESWTAGARAIFVELGLSEGHRRSLLESAVFRSLLGEEPEVLRPAA